jgi:hypothetical protein
MDLHDCYFCSFVIHVLVESHQARFIGFDEVNQPRHTLSFGFELSRLESVRGDEDERARHQFSLLSSGQVEVGALSERCSAEGVGKVLNIGT